jgi:hypothetical protein
VFAAKPNVKVSSATPNLKTKSRSKRKHLPKKQLRKKQLRKKPTNQLTPMYPPKMLRLKKL